MGIIRLNNIRVYAFHGCLAEEAKIGSEYRVDISVKTDFSKPIQSDQLTDTVDYVKLNTIVKKEMAIRSNLLEHVASRIIKRIMHEFEQIKEVRVSVSKINPPLGGDVEFVSVELSEAR